jgi:hypothetical protein
VNAAIFIILVTSVYYIEIEDSACGLTYEQQNILFQPFLQADSSSYRKKGGQALVYGSNNGSQKERIYFLVIKEPLQDWEVNEISRDMLQNDHAINVIGDNTDLPELLNLGITAQNIIIIIISNRQHKINEDIHIITSPLVLIR